MFEYYDLHEGTYRVQSGFRSKVALIDCQYITSRIQVYDAPNVKILDGSEVYWREIRRFYVTRKHGNRQELVIQAVVVGLKHCQYFFDGKNFVATLYADRSEGKTLMGRPVNKKLPLMSIVEGSAELSLQKLFDMCSNKTYQNVYFWVQVVGWDYQKKYPNAVVNGVFSHGKTVDGETNLILHALEIQTQPPKFYRHIMENKSDYLPIKNHREFKHMVFTIDPDNCQDMEDALSIKCLEDNMYEVGIHISDITSYLHLVDREQICERGCSFYFPHTVIPLFPPEIIQMCSLRSKQKKLAMSAFFQMNEKGQIINTRFQKTIIESVAQLTYKEAQNIMDETEGIKEKIQEIHQLTNDQVEELSLSLSKLKVLAFNRRKVRKQEEILDRNQVTFQLGEKNMPIKIGIKKRLDSEKIVEEFMIAINGEVARILTQKYGQDSLIIHHPKPSDYSISNLNSFLSDFGARFKPDTIVTFQSEMKKIFDNQRIKDEVKDVLMVRAIQIQELATYTRYMNSNKGHYGLNMEYYTHFTSPLRRFADVIVHEQLCNYLEKKTVQKHDKKLCREIEVLNKARGRNKKLKQVIVESFLNLYLHQKKEKIAVKALVMSLGLHSATLYIPLYNIMKEVDWKVPVVHSSKDTLKVTISPGHHIEIQKNDSIDIQISSSFDQEVKITMCLG